MPDSKKVPKKENENDDMDENLFKRFKINSETFKMEKSDFDEEIPNNEHAEENILLQENENDASNPEEEINENNTSDYKEEEINENNSPNPEEEENNTSDSEKEINENNSPNPEEEENNTSDSEKEIKELNDEFKLNSNDEENKKNFEGQNNESVDQKSSFEKIDNWDEKFSTEKIKKFFFEDLEYSILALFGLFIGLLLIIAGVMILLGNSEKVVDSVMSGETTASSVLFIIIGVIFIVLSLIKMYPQQKAFGDVFDIIKDLELEIVDDEEETEENNQKPQQETEENNKEQEETQEETEENNKEQEETENNKETQEEETEE